MRTHFQSRAPLTAALVIAMLSMLPGCGGGAEEGAPPETPSRSGPTQSADQAAAPPGANHRAVIVGKWAPTLPDGEARSVTLVQQALAEPPDDKAFERLQPSATEREHFKNIIRLKTTEPDSPLLGELKRKLDGYDAMRMEITPDTIGFRTRGGMSRERYTIVGETDESVTIQSETDRITIRVIDPDHVFLRGTTASIPMTRDDPPGAPAKDAYAGVAGATPGARGADAPPGGAPKAGAPKAGARPSGPADACSAYADCIDKMPRLSGDQAIMGMSSDVIRGWERTPSRLQQCGSALDLARSAGLCP
jgi:hypothetical protein